MVEAIHARAETDGVYHDRIVWSNFPQRKDFLLVREGTATPVWWALFVDGQQEIIDVPPKDIGQGDPLKRTYRWKLPDQLQATNPITAQQFSGLMRQAAGTYHGIGAPIVFSPTWAKTHGIVKFTLTIDGLPVDRYWIVEVRREGVYAAPIVSDLFGVSQYLPTHKEIAADPSLTQAELDLKWAATDGARDGAVRILRGLEAVYDAGAPWYPRCGWAFSASGAEAQQVIKLSGGAGIRTARYKLSFSATPATGLACSWSRLESEKVYVSGNDVLIFAPNQVNEWGVVGQSSVVAEDPIFYDAPIHVLYVGEDPIVTRAVRGPIVSTAEFVGGFYGSSVTSAVTTRGFIVGNNLTLPSGISVKLSNIGERRESDLQNWRHQDTQRDEIFLLANSLILFAEDREALSVVTATNEFHETGSGATLDGIIFAWNHFADPYKVHSIRSIQLTAKTFINGGIIPYLGYLSYVEWDNNVNTFVDPPFDFVTGAHGSQYVPPIPAPTTDKTYGAFTEPQLVASDLTVRHGNIYFPQPDIEPQDQHLNAAYILDATVGARAVGGFADPAARTPIAFVGKA